MATATNTNIPTLQRTQPQATVPADWYQEARENAALLVNRLTAILHTARHGGSMAYLEDDITATFKECGLDARALLKEYAEDQECRCAEDLQEVQP